MIKKLMCAYLAFSMSACVAVPGYSFSPRAPRTPSPQHWSSKQKNVSYSPRLQAGGPPTSPGGASRDRQIVAF